MPIDEREPHGIGNPQSTPVAKGGCGNPSIPSIFGNRATFQGENCEIVEEVVHFGMGIYAMPPLHHALKGWYHPE
jgi:hypothetical protein